ncbi:MAG: hypothetical protein QE485_18745 [Acidovorax sp.]|uniref:hypothetical protein n=1 Tax=Acidovorax sp. TaxID=1872122 RepID=UPI00262131BC|nr:hypothetical protein [Acidovorax sp.]MDH4419255.1 hypothetical protein [Acidovorax sp.]
MKKRVTVFTFALAALLAGMALWPYAPPFETLTVESATVRVKHPGPLGREAVFRTALGAEVSCSRGKSGGCPIEQLVRMEAREAQLTVWHDGVRVFQIADKERILYPYDAVYDGRGFLFAIAVIFALVGLGQMAIHIGWVNEYDDEGKLIQRE